jgi:hypothetical protein
VSTEVKKEIELEIAHVLFLDIVGYSKLSVNEQNARVEELMGLCAPPRNFKRQRLPSGPLNIERLTGVAETYAMLRQFSVAA